MYTLPGEVGCVKQLGMFVTFVGVISGDGFMG